MLILLVSLGAVALIAVRVASLYRHTMEGLAVFEANLARLESKLDQMLAN
jgi:hypothetical protein